MWKLHNQVDTVENWAYANNVCTKEQCQDIIRIGESLLPATATTFGGNCPDIRDSKVSWIHPGPGTQQIFRHLSNVVNTINERFFKFDLVGFEEGLQFTKYEAPAGKYDLHIDKMHGASVRKLSIVIQLSDPADYEGGDLLLKFGGEDVKMEKQQGFMAVFPSYVLHGVQPVTAGTRYSLVAWITGPNFK